MRGRSAPQRSAPRCCMHHIADGRGTPYLGMAMVMVPVPVGALQATLAVASVRTAAPEMRAELVKLQVK